MYTEDFVTYEQALALKKLGFDEYCDYIFTPSGKICPKVILSYDYREREGYVDAPTLWEAQKWLRKEKQIDIEINVYLLGHREYRSVIYNNNNNAIILRPYCSYEEALSAGITKCLELLEIN